jgi:hypothetical protein
MIRRAIFHDLAFVQHDDPVEAAHRRQAMSNRDHGSSAHQPGEGFPDHFLGLAIERGGCFIQQEKRGILQKRARDGNALALAA